VLFVDLDRFKIINDGLGHSAGDQVLKICAQRFAEALRESDLIAHISGDEFVVLLERCNDPAAAIAVARKLLAAAARPILLNGQELALTASVGIALHPADGTDGETLLKHADIALFRAKEQGRNNYQFYSAQMNTHTAERLALEAKLRHALARGELSLHYQPKLDIRTRQVTGVEALLRWNNPELGAVSPATFIPLAEETGLIVPIGAWVLLEACKQAKRWQDSGLPGVRVAVNLSARQFRDPMLGQTIGRAFSESGLDPRLLELEITESMVMQEPEKAAALLKDLKSMGLHLSIDDFGTGYSSLAYLKRFPIDSLKIDRSFVKDIPGNADDLAITQAVVAMAHGLRLRTVAEGVETQEQLEWLKRFGCDEVQGYLFSKALPADEMGRFLASNFRKENTGRFGRGKTAVVA
jgi:diguanylate cyclase (GGDEF)-like protein